MNLRIIDGKNFKKFVVIENLHSKEDFELYEIIKTILMRKEYNPFIGGFNKTISYSYLFQDYVFPLQFLQDVKKQLDGISSKKIEIKNLELMYDNTLLREDFDEYISTLKFPEKYNTTSDEYKFQRDSAFLALKYKMGRIEVGTSGGKTFTTYLYCKYLVDNDLLNTKPNGDSMQIMVVVPTQLLAKQLKSDFIEYNTYMERPISVETIYSGASKLLNADVVCGTFQSLSQYDNEYFDDFCVFICDELHRANSYSIRNGIFAKMLFCEYIFGMTGTEPEYKTLEYLHIVSMFGPRLITVDAHELIETGVATPIKIEQIRITYENYLNYSLELGENGIKGTDKYNLEKEFFHNYKPRTEILGKLLNAIPENSLILVNTISYCYELYDFLVDYCPEWHFEVIHGLHKDYKLTCKREDIIEGMRRTKEHYCIIGTFKTMSTGISINNLYNAYLPDGGKAQTNIGQAIGRLMRLFDDKVVGRLFDLQDDMRDSAYRKHYMIRNHYYEKKKFPIKLTKIKI